MIKGRCLCGAVRITVARSNGEVSVCHCAMCRRWSGGIMAGFVAPAEAVAVTGEVGRFASSDFSERAFCPRCGSGLWMRDTGGDYELSPGLFDGAADFPLVREVYADRAHRFAALKGDHPRITRADYEQNHPHVEGNA
ncbi:GFA family protein [Paracoccus sp. (in: a-proteobacteria)]|uniref:GFA family protein n=1 Tax=Paracoccus sp. TaxID=267 RepID=UPI0026DFE57F|nr:GFA family protein [Paracoccus sp. (in: a-proteobacteria)]MDO5371557.1 GFA family protein [Paracoccus sp. (in: a-proteobacteria)]